MVEIVGAGGPADKASIPLATRGGTFINNERRPDWPLSKIRASVQQFKRDRPDARLRSVGPIYNCLGMLFAARRTSIDPDQLQLILTEDEYRPLPGPGDCDVGDVVVYKTPDGEIAHVGMILTKTADVASAKWLVRVLSKWGAEGEYDHPIDYGPPMLGQPAEFWTDRRTV